MANAIVYCDACSRMIRPSEVPAGMGATASGGALCPDCIAKLPPERVKELMRRADADAPMDGPAPRRAGGTRPSTTRRPARASGGGNVSTSNKQALVVVGLGVGTMVVTIAMVTLLRSPSEDGPRDADMLPPLAVAVQSPPAVVPAAPLPVAPSPSPAAPGDAASTTARRDVRSPARRRLERLRAMHDPSLGKYAEIREGLEALLQTARGTPDAAEAEKFLAELDRQHAKLAEEALALATDSARNMASGGEYEAANRSIRSVARRFGDGPWLKSTGEAQIEAALGVVKAMRAEHESREGQMLIEGIPYPPEPSEAADGQKLVWGWHSRQPAPLPQEQTLKIRPGEALLRGGYRCMLSNWSREGYFVVPARGTVRVCCLLRDVEAMPFVTFSVSHNGASVNHHNTFKPIAPNTWTQFSVRLERFAGWDNPSVPPPGGVVNEISVVLDAIKGKKPGVLISEIQVFADE